jgi:hypothetical protein
MPELQYQTYPSKMDEKVSHPLFSRCLLFVFILSEYYGVQQGNRICIYQCIGDYSFDGRHPAGATG